MERLEQERNHLKHDNDKLEAKVSCDTRGNEYYNATRQREREYPFLVYNYATFFARLKEKTSRLGKKEKKIFVILERPVLLQIAAVSPLLPQ